MFGLPQLLFIAYFVTFTETVEMCQRSAIIDISQAEHRILQMKTTDNIHVREVNTQVANCNKKCHDHSNFRKMHKQYGCHEMQVSEFWRHYGRFFQKS